MSRDGSSALEMKEMEGSLKASSSHTLNYFLTQVLAQRKKILALGGRGVNALGCVCLVVGQQLMKGRCRGTNTPPPKLPVTVQKLVFIGTTDLRSVLPRIS
jgi:hypothetical protein